MNIFYQSRIPTDSALFLMKISERSEEILHNFSLYTFHFSLFS